MLNKTQNAADVFHNDEDGIEAVAQIAAEVNQSVENIGARRLYTII